MIDELERMWKEGVMTYFEVLSHYWPERLRNTVKNLRMISVLGYDLNQTQAPMKIYVEMEV
jgi:hypothetical protein